MTNSSAFKLSKAEQEGLEWLRHHGGAVSADAVPVKSEKEIIFGRVLPGITIFRKLEKKGLVFFTEEEPVVFDDGTEFTFGSEIYLVTNS